MKIKIFTTGGSIDKRYSTQTSDFIVADPQIETILRDGNVAFEFEIEPLLRKDSLAITEEDRRLILEKIQHEPLKHIIITHGTDTMPETARTLAAVKGKTICLTGAMQPAAFKQTDAYFNIGFAAAAVQILPAGVHLVMNGRVFDPNRVRKNVPLDRFEDIDR